MKIAIVGAGAMGSVYAGLLAGSNDVWALDVWADHVAAINRHGLRVEGASGDRTVALRATTDAADIGPCDLVVIATKAAQVGEAARAVSPLLRPDTLILTIQNGLGAGERIAEHLPMDNILLGVAGGFGASMKGPGHVHHNGMELIRLGEIRGGLSARLSSVESVWREAGFNVQSFADINQLVWEKFICNVTYSGPCTVLECDVATILGNAHAWSLASACATEAYEAGRAKGVNFSFDDPVAYVHAFGAKIPASIPSMLQDFRARRPTEVGAINGMVPVVAQQVGTDAPKNEAVVAIVRAKEAISLG